MAEHQTMHCELFSGSCDNTNCTAEDKTYCYRVRMLKALENISDNLDQLNTLNERLDSIYHAIRAVDANVG
ncbi:MAG: hypothetical protein LBH79_03115 [Nitrososphaerota archaeon]|jgi:hypothetical protein|nr:hypothetical protein [Nitrososphaerota archaeon]